MKSVWLSFCNVTVVGLPMAMLNIDCGIMDRAVLTGLLIMAVAVHCKADVKADVIGFVKANVKSVWVGDVNDAVMGLEGLTV